MKNTFGSALTVTIFGESHGPAIGAVLDGLSPGIPVDRAQIEEKLALRRPQDETATARREKDEFTIESGVFKGMTTGTPLVILIPNRETRSGDYGALSGWARPSHADYPAFLKYHGFEDARGGGHFSGRVTAALVAAGAILSGALRARGVRIGTHLCRCAGLSDRPFAADPAADFDFLDRTPFPVLSKEAAGEMRAAILAARAAGDSVGGVLETLVTGLPGGLGEPFFDSVESLLAHGLFSIPAVKGVEFGDGFGLSARRGSEVNDRYRAGDGGICPVSGHGGGVGGGVTDGSPLCFRVAVKPTPSIALPQESADFRTGENRTVVIGGRHDPCVAPRARAVADAVTALVLSDLLTVRFGTDFLAGGTKSARTGAENAEKDKKETKEDKPGAPADKMPEKPDVSGGKCL